jgi:putative hydrolase of the HAD superfamily
MPRWKVIFFDAAGTLFRLTRSVGEHYAEVAARHGAVFDPGVANAAFFAAWKAMAAPAETDGPRPDDDRDWWQALVGRMLDELGVTLDRSAYFSELWTEFAKPGVWELFPETHGVLVSLGQRFRLGVISNFDSRLHTILAQLGISHFFEHVIVSSEVGADKPSPRIFAEALDQFDVTPEFALHIGDEPQADWAGAEAAGMGVFRLKRPENSLSDIHAGV